MKTRIEIIKKYKRTGETGKQKFKSRKSTTQSCYIPKSAITDKGIYNRLSGKINFREKIPENPLDSRLILENGR